MLSIVMLQRLLSPGLSPPGPGRKKEADKRSLRFYYLYFYSNPLLHTLQLGGFFMCSSGTTTGVSFSGTPEQKEKLLQVIAAKKDEPGALMPILQEAQAIYGYLPIEVQTIIAEEMDIPLEKVYGVSTFYAQFSLNPKGRNQISVCLGTACYVKGSGLVMEEIEKQLGIQDGECTADGKFSLDSCRCVGACGLAPVMLVNDDVYGRMTPDQVKDILAKYE